MDPQELFRANLSLIGEVVAGVCRRARIFGADAEDFGSSVTIALMENDYAILRQYQGRASLFTYLTIVVDRMLSNARMRDFGRWRPSTEALRLGPAAVLLETLVSRDHRSLDEALPHILAADPTLTRSTVEAMLERLPTHKRRPKRTDDEEAMLDVASTDRADASALARDAEHLSKRTAAAVKDAMAGLPLEDRMLLRLRFVSSMSISDISRMMRLPQRPLYRRFETLLAKLRGAVLAAGLDPRDVESLIGTDQAQTMDFAFVENHGICQSVSNEEPHAAAGEPS